MKGFAIALAAAAWLTTVVLSYVLHPASSGSRGVETTASVSAARGARPRLRLTTTAAAAHVAARARATR